MFLSILADWVTRTARGLEDSFDAARSTTIMTGVEVVGVLDQLEVGRRQWKELVVSWGRRVFSSLI